MKNLIQLLWLLILLVVQHTLIPFISIKGISPDILLIFVLYWSGIRHRTYGVMMGFTAGLLQDLAGVGTTGVFALSKAVAAYAGYSFPMSRHEKNILPWSITLFIGSVLHYSILIFIQTRTSSTGFFTMMLRYGLPSILYTTVMGMVIYFFVEYVIKKSIRR